MIDALAAMRADNPLHSKMLGCAAHSEANSHSNQHAKRSMSSTNLAGKEKNGWII
jgi:hypothetical protein